MAENITIGANKLIEIQLLDELGANLLLSSLSNVTAQIIQYNRVLSTLVYTPGTADPEIRAGSTSSKIEIEITQAISAKFKEGDVYCRLRLAQVDIDFDVDDKFWDLPKEVILTAVL